MELSIKCGNQLMGIMVSDKLAALMLETQKRKIRDKRTAKIRKIYYGEIDEETLLLSPSYIFALEETMEQYGYVDLLHTTLLQFESQKEKDVIYKLLRQGKPLSLVERTLQITEEKICETVQNFFRQIDKKLWRNYEEL